MKAARRVSHRAGSRTVLTGAVHAEWTKLRTVPSTAWLVVAAVVLTVALGALMTVTLDYRHCRLPCVEDTLKLSLFGVRLGQVAVVVLAVLAVSNEHATGMIQATVTAVPRRMIALLAKFAVVAGTVLVAGAAGVAGSILAGRWILPGRGFTPAHGYPALSLADEATRRAAIGTVLYLVLVAMLSAGVAVLVRDTAAAVAVVLGLLFVAPLAATLAADPRWAHRLHRYAPMDAGLAVQVTRHVAPADVGPWAGLGVLAVYAAAVTVALLTFELRDV